LFHFFNFSWVNIDALNGLNTAAGGYFQKTGIKHNNGGLRQGFLNKHLFAVKKREISSSLELNHFF